MKCNRIKRLFIIGLRKISLLASSIAITILLVLGGSAFAEETQAKISPSRYDFISSKDGNVYRLDKSTGTVSRILGTRIIPLKESQSNSYFKQWEPKENKEKTYTLKTHWIDGLLHIQGTERAPDKSDTKLKISKQDELVGINFYDANGIKIKRVPNDALETIYVFDTDSKLEIKHEGEIELTLQEYLSIENWDYIISLDRADRSKKPAEKLKTIWDKIFGS